MEQEVKYYDLVGLCLGVVCVVIVSDGEWTCYKPGLVRSLVVKEVALA
jgi:nicotinamide riboside transporter PnuC